MGSGELGLVVPGRVDAVLSDDLAGGGIGGDGVVVVDQDQDVAAGVSAAVAEVTQAAGVAQ